MPFSLLTSFPGGRGDRGGRLPFARASPVTRFPRRSPTFLQFLLELLHFLLRDPFFPCSLSYLFLLRFQPIVCLPLSPPLLLPLLCCFPLPISRQKGSRALAVVKVVGRWVSGWVSGRRLYFLYHSLPASLLPPLKFPHLRPPRVFLIFPFAATPWGGSSIARGAGKRCGGGFRSSRSLSLRLSYGFAALPRRSKQGRGELYRGFGCRRSPRHFLVPDAFKFGFDASHAHIRIRHHSPQFPHDPICLPGRSPI